LLVSSQTKLKSDGIQRKREQEDLEKRIILIESQVRELAALKAQVTEWSNRLEDATQLAGNLKAIAARLDSLTKKLAAGDFGKEEQAALLKVMARIAILESAERELGQVRATIKDLQDRRVEALFAQAAEAEKGSALLDKDISERESIFSSRKQALVQEDK